jgi:hypothetical protein
MAGTSLAMTGRRAVPYIVIPDNAPRALIRNLAGLEKIPGSPRRGAPE